jgi:23S rRNA (adenine2503-C2)-methyltransferase
MGNIPNKLKDQLADHFQILPFTVLNKITSKDGTVKYAFKLFDDNVIEAVHIPMEKGKITFCISSQVGCAMGCKFCNTAKMGFIRNLEVAEIVSQVLFLKKQAEILPKQAFNIVFMGMGEPFLNLENVLKAIEIITDENGINLSYRRITVSTCGIVEGFDKLAKLEKKPRLAISLNAADNETRKKVMPVTKKYSLNSLIEALKNYPLSARDRFTFEYVLIEGVNNSLKDAANVLKLLNGLKYKLNLIPYNEFKESNLKKPSEKSVEDFQKYLADRGVTVIVRKSKGDDISAACGQLASKVLDNGL